MFKVLLTIAALMGAFAFTGIHAASAHAQAASVYNEVAAIRAHMNTLGITEDISTIPLSAAYSHTVIVEGDRWAVASRDPQGGIWVASDATEPILLGALSLPIPAESEVVAAYGFAGDRLASAINTFVAQNVAEGVGPDAVTQILMTLDAFERSTGLDFARKGLTPTPAASAAG